MNNTFERALVFMHKVSLDPFFLQLALLVLDYTAYISTNVVFWDHFVTMYCHMSTFSCFIQMPRIWLDYCQFLMDQHLITRIRRTFDRALRALPITQHYRIWPLYLKFVHSYPIPETAVRVYRRYLKVMECSITVEMEQK